MAKLDEQFTAKLEEAVGFNDAQLALSLLEHLREVLSSVPSSDLRSRQDLEEMEAEIMGVALRFLSRASLVDLFEHRLSFFLRLPTTVNVIENVKDRLSEETFVEERNKLRQALREAIERSDSQIGKSQIKLGSESIPSTIANWLRLYVSEVGTNPTSVKLARFFAQNPAVLSLTLEEKAALQNLVKLYEYLKLRSDQLEGYENETVIEDEQGNLNVFKDGKFQSLYKKSSLKLYKELAREGSLSHETLVDLIVKFPEEFKEFTSLQGFNESSINPESVSQRTQDFFATQAQQYAKTLHVSGVPLPTRTAALVAMLHKAVARGQEADLILCREILQSVVGDQERFVNFMRHTSIIKLIQDEFPSALGEKNKGVVKQSPASPMALQALLSIIFSKFNLAPEEVIWHAFEVLQKIPLSLKEFKTIVTYDVSQNKLVWRY